MHLHGALGISNEMPFAKMMVNAQVMAIADGPTEVHKITVARQVLKHYSAGRGPVAQRPPPRPAGGGPGALRRAPRARDRQRRVSDPLDLTGKVAVVTGGSRGLGRAMSVAFAEHGATVVVASRKVEACAGVGSRDHGRHRPGGGRPRLPRRATGTTATGWWTQVYDRFGRVDVLVNNAGMSPLYESLRRREPRSCSTRSSPSTCGARSGCRRSSGAAWPTGGGGSIINVSSIAAVVPPSARGALRRRQGRPEQPDGGLARAFAPTVRVNCIMAGPFLTDISRAWDIEAFERQARTAIPLRRGGQPEEIVGAALYLASDASVFTDGVDPQGRRRLRPRLVMSAGSDTRARLVAAGERLFARARVDGVSLREINGESGARNAIAIQYHFTDRAGLLRAIFEKHTPDVEARRHALLDQYEADGTGDLRTLAAALVRPLAAKLSDHDGGREFLQILADLLNRPRPAVDPAALEDTTNSLYRWRALVDPFLAPMAVELHRRFTAVIYTAVELGRRARSGPDGDDRLFVSHLIDVVTSILAAPVSDETRRLARGRSRTKKGAPRSPR